MDDRVTVTTANSGSACGAEFELGHRYSIGASPSEYVNRDAVLPEQALEDPPPIDKGQMQVNPNVLAVVLVVIAVLLWALLLRRLRAAGRSERRADGAQVLSG